MTCQVYSRNYSFFFKTELLASLSKETAKDTFEELSTKMNSLKKFLSDSTVFLPKFAVKTAQEVSLLIN